MLHHEEITGEIVDGAIEVHRVLGPGLLESAYEICLFRELTTRGLKVERQAILPVFYKGATLDCGYRLDMVVNDAVIVEIKCTSELTDLHRAQLLTYLRLSSKKVGLLLNFNANEARHCKNGTLKKVVHSVLSVPLW